MTIKIPVPYSGGLFLTYKCIAECRHCMYACSQKWKADWISEENLTKILSQLAGKIQASPYGHNSISLNHGLHITGGEPFLNFDLLCKAVEISSGFGIPSLFVETNCFWCIDDETTREKLVLLQDKGLLEFAGDLGYKENKEGYYSKCHLCVDIRKYLLDKKGTAPS